MPASYSVGLVVLGPGEEEVHELVARLPSFAPFWAPAPLARHVLQVTGHLAERVEQLLRRQHLHRHVAERGPCRSCCPPSACWSAGRRLASCRWPGSGTSGRTRRSCERAGASAVEQLRVRSARSPACMSSTGLTKPRPNSCAQVRLTIALAKNGFSGGGHPLRQHRAVRVACRPASARRRRGTSAARSWPTRGRSPSAWCGRCPSVTPICVLSPPLFAFSGVVGLHLAEERGHAPVLGLLPVGERVVVALGALELDAEEVLGRRCRSACPRRGWRGSR